MKKQDCARSWKSWRRKAGASPQGSGSGPIKAVHKGRCWELLAPSLLLHRDCVCHMLILYFQPSAFSIFREINIENSVLNKCLDSLKILPRQNSVALSNVISNTPNTSAVRSDLPMRERARKCTFTKNRMHSVHHVRDFPHDRKWTRRLRNTFSGMG